MNSIYYKYFRLQAANLIPFIHFFYNEWFCMPICHILKY